MWTIKCVQIYSLQHYFYQQTLETAMSDKGGLFKKLWHQSTMYALTEWGNSMFCHRNGLQNILLQFGLKKKKKELNLYMQINLHKWSHFLRMSLEVYKRIWYILWENSGRFGVKVRWWIIVYYILFGIFWILYYMYEVYIQKLTVDFSRYSRADRITVNK